MIENRKNLKIISDFKQPHYHIVEFYMKASNINIIKEEIHLAKNEHNTKSFKEKNIFSQVPILKIGDENRYISESISIIKFLESIFQPDSRLLGNSFEEIINIDMWYRKIEFNIFLPIVEYGHYSDPFFKNLFKQSKDISDMYLEKAKKGLNIVNGILNSNDYVYNRFSIADIILYCAYQLVLLYKVDISGLIDLIDWSEKIKLISGSECMRNYNLSKH